MNPWEFMKATVATVFLCIIVTFMVGAFLSLLYGYESSYPYASAVLLAFLLSISRGFYAGTKHPAIGIVSIVIFLLWLGEVLRWGEMTVSIKGSVLSLNVAPLLYLLMLSALIGYGSKILTDAFGKRLSTTPA